MQSSILIDQTLPLLPDVERNIVLFGLKGISKINTDMAKLKTAHTNLLMILFLALRLIKFQQSISLARLSSRRRRARNHNEEVS